jgi:hypothetical protein
MKFSISKTLKGALILALLDLVLMWIWVKNEDLDGAAMFIYILVPFVFIINWSLVVSCSLLKELTAPCFLSIVLLRV